MTQPKSLVAERYRLIELLGAGGMGRVWLARDEMLRRDVAIKEVIPPGGLTAEERDELRLRTLREARAAARLNDPNVVRIYDVVQTEQAPWIVMEYVPSRSLHQVITDDGPLPPERVAQIGLAVLSALRAAHAAGVLHRDVKPGNVLLADTGRVVLTDFGLAVFEGGDGAVTRPGLILGSPQYISPERAREGISDPASDLWSLGATLYAAVEGRSPYARSTTYATLTALATEEPDPPTRAGVLKPVLNALLRKDPRSRAAMAETERLLLRAASGTHRGWPWTLPALPRPRRSKEGHVTGLRSPSGGGSRGSGGPVHPVTGSDAVTAVPVAPVSGPPDGGEPVSAPPAGGSEGSSTPEPGGPRIDFPGRAVEINLDEEAPAPATGDERRKRWTVLAAAVAVAAVVVAAVLLITGSGDEEPGSRPTGLPSAIETTAQPAPPGDNASQSPAPSRSPQVEGSFGNDVLQLPAGYHYETDPTWGWTVAVPDGWIRTPHESSRSMIYFVSNTDQRMRMGIDTTDKPSADPVADWTAQEAQRLRGRMYANYQRVKIEPAQFIGNCADWQWTYDSSRGGRMHVSNLGCRIRPDLGHAIYWEVPEDLWASQPVTTMYGLIRVSFRPKPA
ncbi:serine/threonine-protein kinase [Dactylosporangium fulvum]|uniref:non-specific serine/threonine protein kinase n=1 Tax=Dactylosporangium fulvum TaxID=53359 RepID=A0ABY5W146_9ACTN|nr:serine/threonine-protein kinase [Dactylosporangium fulvum]UWP83687.1 protein kinase [Dactylosporangium fulvum]